MAVARNALLAGAAAAVTRLTGIAREVAFAAAFGAGIESDAYNAAFRVPNLFRDLFAEGSMANAFVPTYARAVERDGLRSGWALANAVLGLLLLALGAVTVLMIAGADWWVWIVASGFWSEPGKGELTATLVRILSPFLACVSVASLFAGMLNVRGRFFGPALAPAAFNLVVLVACLVPPGWQEPLGLDPIVTVAVASVVGGALQFLVQLPALWAEGFTLRPSLAGHPELRRVLAFLAPALVGIATIQAGVLVDQQIASNLGNGPVTWLRYAFQVAQLPMHLLAGAIAVASVAALSSQVGRNDLVQARQTLADSLALTAWAVIPAAVALFVLAEPIVSTLFERGEFTPEDTRVTALVLQGYAVGAVAFAIHRVVVPAFYAWGDPWTPAVLSVATIAAKIPLALWWAAWLGTVGIALAHAVVASIEVAVLCVLVTRRAGGGWTARRSVDVLRSAAVAAFVGVAAWAAAAWLPSPWLVVPVIGVAGVAYLAATWALGAPHLGSLWAVVRPSGLPPHVDATTSAALAAHTGRALVSVERTPGRAVLTTDLGVLEIWAEASELRASSSGEPSEERGSSCRITGVLSLRDRPPPLVAIIVETQVERHVFAAHGDALDADAPPGPRVEVVPGRDERAAGRGDTLGTGR